MFLSDLFLEVAAEFSGRPLLWLFNQLQPVRSEAPVADFGPHEQEIQFHVNERIEQLLGDHAEFLALYDLDGNKVIDEDEMELARAEIRATILRDLDLQSYLDPET